MPNPASLQDTALEHLRVIRTLMERAHIYRAVSAPAALVGGLLSLAVGAYGYQRNHSFMEGSFHGQDFLLAWCGVLVVTGIANFILLIREANSKGERPFGDSMRMALRSLVPPMLSGGILGSCLIFFGPDAALGSLVWILCYGLALQATVSFAPRSITLLARAFIVTGQILVILYFLEVYHPAASAGFHMRHYTGEPGFLPQEPNAIASLFLGLTFGLYHIIYAIAVFASKPHPADTEAERFIEAP
jgi:hypothetical protein